MKYIITELQSKMIDQTIIKFFNDNLTPYDGWDSHESYENEVEENSELFLHIKDGEGWNMERDNHMWYSICDNPNLSGPLPKGHCPVVTIPESTFDALDAYFGDNWKRLFRRWFTAHTGLLVVQIDTI